MSIWTRKFDDVIGGGLRRYQIVTEPVIFDDVIGLPLPINTTLNFQALLHFLYTFFMSMSHVGARFLLKNGNAIWIEKS